MGKAFRQFFYGEKLIQLKFGIEVGKSVILCELVEKFTNC